MLDTKVITTKIDKSPAMAKFIKELIKKQITVGYTDPIAVQLAYTKEFGSPALNIPAQPFFLKSIKLPNDFNTLLQNNIVGGSSNVVCNKVADNVETNVAANTGEPILQSIDKEIK